MNTYVTSVYFYKNFSMFALKFLLAFCICVVNLLVNTF